MPLLVAESLNSVAERLASLGRTAPELADIAGVDKSTAYRWLDGGSKPYRKFLRRIGDATGVRPEWLETGEGERDAPTGSTNEPTPRMPSVTSLMSDPEARSPYADLGLAGSSIVSEARDAHGQVIYAVRVQLLARAEPEVMTMSTRIESESAHPPRPAASAP